MGRAVNPRLDTARELEAFVGLAVFPRHRWAGAVLCVVHPGVPFKFFSNAARLSLSITARNWFGSSNGDRRADGVGEFAFLPLAG